MEFPVFGHNVNFPGYGGFWVANSITSTVMGFANRAVQNKATEDNIAFQRELQRAREITEDKKMQEEIAFKRRLLSISRQYQQEQVAAQYENQIKRIDLQEYLRTWPLNKSLPNTALTLARNASNGQSLPLNVILLHSTLKPLKRGIPDVEDKSVFASLEKDLEQQDFALLGNVLFHRDAAQDSHEVFGGNSTIINIHFLMGQIPTLVISPRYDEYNKRIEFTAAVWEAQAERPMILPLFSMEHDAAQMLDAPYYQSCQIAKIRTAITAITGVVRDSYMILTRGGKATFPELLSDPAHNWMKSIIEGLPALKQYINNEYNNILLALDEQKTPMLLDVYSKEDLMAMRKQVKAVEV